MATKENKELETGIDQFMKNLCRYMQDSQEELSRYRSWNHCYEQFQSAFKKRKTDRDMLCLWLAWYLASWGMLHNSMLLSFNYKIHAPIVNIILDMDKKSLKTLNNLECQNWLDNKDDCQKNSLICITKFETAMKSQEFLVRTRWLQKYCQEHWDVFPHLITCSKMEYLEKVVGIEELWLQIT